MLIDTQLSHQNRVGVGQPDRRGVDRRLHGPPRHAIGRRDLIDGTAGVDHGVDQLLPQPSQTPCPERELIGDLDGAQAASLHSLLGLTTITSTGSPPACRSRTR